MDAKITALDANTTPASTDLTVIVDDPGGTPATQKMTIDTLDDYLSATTKTLTNKTLTSPTLGGTPVLDATSAIPFYNDSLNRQAIINGNFDIWQRGTSDSTPTITYLADRWQAATNGTSFTQSRDTDVPAGSKYSHKIVATLDAVEYLDRSYRIESNDATKLSGKEVTLSFQHKDSVTAGTNTITAYLAYCSASDNFGTEEFVELESSIAISGTYVRKNITFTIAATSPTNGYAASNGLEIKIRYVQATDTGTSTSNISQVQLCAGSIALPFQPKSFAQELADCQRYYYKYGADSAIRCAILGNTWDSAGRFAVNVQTRVQMRATPTVAIYSGDGWRGISTHLTGVANVGSIGSPSSVTISDNGILLRWTGEDTTDFPTYSSVAVWGRFTADAEL